MALEEELRQQVRDLQERLSSLQSSKHSESHVSAISIKLSDFWEDKPKLWFAQAEAQFEIAGITQDSTKYGYILSKLDARLADEVEDVIASPPSTGKYEHLKRELIRRLSSSKEQRVRKLLSEEQLGDRKPSAFLRHLRSLAGNTVGDEGIIRELWMRRLPPDVQRILTAQRDLPLDKVAEIADAISETPQSVHAAFSPLSELDSIKKALSELSQKVDALCNERQSRHQAKSRSRSNSRSTSQSANHLCWYHTKFADKANKCITPCKWKVDKGNSTSSQ